MEHTYVQLLHLLAAHATWTLGVAFVAAFLEAIAIIGTFVPGSIAMFVAGALVGTGALNAWWLFAVALVGAVAGDGLSYWLGRRYRTHIAAMWPFRTHPAILETGQRYVAKHGARSVITARFIAPLRAVVPVVAGMLGMTPARFYAMNIASAFVWAPAHIVPGIFFGASLQLAGAVSFRLISVIGILALIGWLSFRAASFVIAHAHAWQVASRRALTRWAGRHDNRTAHFVVRMLDPARPETGLIAAISLLVLLSTGLFFSVFVDVKNGDPLMQVDMSVSRFLQSIHSIWADALLSDLATLGSVTTLLSIIASVALWMMIERRWRTVLYWLMAAAFSQLLIFVIKLTMYRVPSAAMQSGFHAFPSNHVAATVIVYGFLAFLLARRVGKLEGMVAATLCTAVSIAVAFAGLYFGQFSVLDAVGGATFAAVWVAVVALTAVWRHPEAPPPRTFMPLVILLVIGVTVGVQVVAKPSDDLAASSQHHNVVVVTEAQWIDSLWKTFPCYRSTMKGERREPLTVQWAASIGQIEAQLTSRGWIGGERFTTGSLLSMLSPEADAMALPVMPKLNNGEPSVLVFSRARDVPEERDVLRFWATDYAVESKSDSQPRPIWIGSLVHERLHRPLWPLNVLRPDPRTDALIAPHSDAWSKLEVSTHAGCQDIPVTLIASRHE